ncbi:Uncharacterised protein [Mycobacteroides abscessus subsp. abscessus]|nr:Uncharacterised protein [Mycobacteroides abscessus subsp. abscessus]
MHHRLLHGGHRPRTDLIGGDSDNGGVQGVYPFAGHIGEGVGHGDQVAARYSADRRQLHVDMQFVPGDDRPVLFKDLFGL